MTQGISPKVAWPSVALFVVGVALAVVGAVTSAEGLTPAGLGLIGASGITGAIGYRAPVGSVVPDEADEASDDLLDPEVREKIEKTPG